MTSLLKPKTFVPILLTLLIPLIGSLFFAQNFGDVKWVHTLFHSTLEATGAGIAVIVATVLIYQSRSERVPPHFLWVSLALICMGILDFFHGFVIMGPAFYWSRTLSSFFGGLLFLGAWLPERFSSPKAFRYMPPTIAILSSMLGLFFIIEPEALPLMYSAAGYTLMAKLINLVGGIVFFLATWNYLKRFYKTDRAEDYLFGLHCMILGMAEMLFAFSSLWNSVWWFFHVLRLVAYILVIKQIFRSYEEALAQTEIRYRSVVDNMSEGFMLFDPSGNLIYQNPASLFIHGFDPDQIGAIPKTDLEITWDAKDESGRDIGIEEWPVSRVFNYERFQNQILHVKRRENGHEFFGSYNGSQILDTQGKIVSGYLTIRDITDLVKAQNEMKLSEHKFRTFIESMPQIAFIADPDGNMTFFNQRHYDYFGVKFGETEGWDWKFSQIIHPDDLSDTVQRWTNSLTTGEFYHNEYRLKRYDGEYRWHLARAYPIRNDNKKIVSWVGTNTDIHDQKKLAADLQAAIQVRDEFLSIASHELKTPITSLKIQAQIAMRGRDRGDTSIYSPEKVNKLIDQFDRQVERLNRLVDDMLDISRIRTGQLALQIERFDICSMINEVIERLSPNLIEAKTPAHFDFEGTCEILGDRMKLEQVITNLLTNAMKYGNQKPINVQVSKPDLKTLRITVKDQGMGISSDARERIFDRFEREINTSVVGGLGLGLFITKQIVDAHGGKIWVESDGSNHGSIFYVELVASL